MVPVPLVLVMSKTSYTDDTRAPGDRSQDDLCS
jgi:hypothetical protein